MTGCDGDGSERGLVGAHAVGVLMDASAMPHTMTVMTRTRICDCLTATTARFATCVPFAVIHPMVRV